MRETRIVQPGVGVGSGAGVPVVLVVMVIAVAVVIVAEVGGSVGVALASLEYELSPALLRAVTT